MTRFVVTFPDGADPAELLYLEALQRLADGRPSAASTIALRKANKLTISQLTVALEAGRSSRTPISGDKARWPRVRDEIERAKTHFAKVSRMSDQQGQRDARKTQSKDAKLIKELKAQITRLRQECAMAYAKSAAAILLLDEATRKSVNSIRTPEERVASRRAAEEQVRPCPVEPEVPIFGGSSIES